MKKDKVQVQSGRVKKEVPPNNRAADAAAVAGALLCAAFLCFFAGSSSSSDEIMINDAIYVIAGDSGITYNEPENDGDWSFWDYFSDQMASFFKGGS